MASSGIEVDPNFKEAYNKMKTKKTHQLLVAALSDDKKNVILKEDLCKELCSPEELRISFKELPKECLYAVYDFKEKNKLILIKWAPDTAPASKKMIYASTFATMKTCCEGAKTIEATELDDLSVESLENAKS
ncbi:cofilin [ [Paramuricea clavata]|uniref:Cofilin n=1 Tax=Paramuricea clavata TaxID=317549 RepID=A0A7D9E3W1_PARCT|nr:cofilin [ [Paramuricea clavata]